jgi:hypothetical protein
MSISLEKWRRGQAGICGHCFVSKSPETLILERLASVAELRIGDGLQEKIHCPNRRAAIPIVMARLFDPGLRNAKYLCRIAHTLRCQQLGSCCEIAFNLVGNVIHSFPIPTINTQMQRNVGRSPRAVMGGHDQRRDAACGVLQALGAGLKAAQLIAQASRAAAAPAPGKHLRLLQGFRKPPS